MAAEPVFASDAELRHAGEQASFAPGERLTLSDDYRLCHLPLVAPGHPDVIAADAARGYAMGRHAEVLSLVAPLDPDQIEGAPTWRAMSAGLSASPLAAKIAWHVMPMRRARLHATLCGSLTAGELASPFRERLASLEPFSLRVGGVFAGRKNAGRIYLKLHPELRDGTNMFDAVQAAFGRTPSRFYVAGVWNLTDHLDEAETAALVGWLARWRDATVAETRLDALHLLASHDDLVLDARVVEAIALI